MQAAMQEPSTVMMTMSSLATKYSPGSTLAALYLKWWSWKKNDASPGLRGLDFRVCKCAGLLCMGGQTLS
jgi:hypothetical protein